MKFQRADRERLPRYNGGRFRITSRSPPGSFLITSSSLFIQLSLALHPGRTWTVVNKSPLHSLRHCRDVLNVRRRSNQVVQVGGWILTSAHNGIVSVNACSTTVENRRVGTLL